MPQHVYWRALACAILAFAMPCAAAAAQHFGGYVAPPQTKEQLVLSFNGSDGNLPNAGLIEDKHGNLYGTTSYNGGTHGYGNVFELSHSRAGWKETVLYNFTGGADGAFPIDSLVMDAKGNLYGTTQVGGQGHCTNGNPSLGCGVAFELSPGASGWTETVLYSFVPGQTLGVIPVGGLVFDSAGNLYGTTWAPGVSGGPLGVRRDATRNTFWGCNLPGCGGTVFELSPASGGWKETDLYAFTGGADGAASVANLIMDAAGNLYGTTNYGGTTGCVSGYGCGVAFELSHRRKGWKEKILHTFTGGTDGAYPTGSLLWDSAGNLYSTASAGGTKYGVVFELSPSGNTWSENILYSFTGQADGASPTTAVIWDSNGNLYGTTNAGGSPSFPSGVAFKLSPSSKGWTQSVLHTFTYVGHDGQAPNAPLLFGPHGDLYGTTQSGGAYNQGTVFEVAP